MDFAWLEAEIRARFGTQRAALVAALHEVQVCVEFPECYAAILQMYPDETPNRAILQGATVRGKQWMSQCHGPGLSRPRPGAEGNCLATCTQEINIPAKLKDVHHVLG
jgi:hypothetical protein